MNDSLFANPGRTKLALVSHGVALPDGLPKAQQWVSQANSIETVVDMKLPSGHFATVPVGLPYTQQSSVSLQVDDDGNGTLCHEGETLQVDILKAPAFYQKKTRSGARMGSFASMHGRLLMLHPMMGCGFFSQKGNACQYCQYDSMMNDAEPPLRDPLEMVEVIQAALEEREVDTVYLYNGYSPSPDMGLSRLIPVIALLRRHLGHRQIALETVAPSDVSAIDGLYVAGLDMFICNLEIHDSAVFAEICPGKAEHGGQETIFKALQHACSVFRAGAVVSNLIVGLEPLDSTKAGMEKLVNMGVVPLLQPFRPLPGTALENRAMSSLQELEDVFLHLYGLLQASDFPTHRLRHMGRVMTPMESRVLDGKEPALQERIAASSLGQHVESLVDRFRRHLRSDENKTTMDRRPIEVLMFKQTFPFALIVLFMGMAWYGIAQPAPDGLGDAGWRSLVIFGLCLSLWITQLIPLSVTSLLGLALLPLLDVLPANEVFALFGNPVVFFILGAFLLAAGLLKTGLTEHLALAVMSRFSNGPKTLLGLMLFLPAGMASLMPEHAVAALFLPIVLQMVNSLGLSPGHPYAQSLFFAMAWGAIIGGVATLLGGARGPLALGLVEELTGETFSFVEWSVATAPLVLLMLVAAWLVLSKAMPDPKIDTQKVRDNITRRRLEIGVTSLNAKMMAALMVFTVFGWALSGHSSSLAGIALVSVVVMFALRLVRWEEIEQHVSWGVVLMYGGAIALGKALTVTGAGTWLASELLPGSLGGIGLLLAIAGATLLLTECVSNAAAVAILLPVALPFGMASGMDPVVIALTVGVVSGFAFMLPMGTPPNAMVYASGYIQTSHMLRYGAILSLTALVGFALLVTFWWPLIGLEYR